MSIFFTLFLIVFGGVLLNKLAKRIRIPPLVLYLLYGVLLSLLQEKVGSSFIFLDSGVRNISSPIRKVALIIILLKAGLSLNLYDLKKVGRPAILRSFLPACTERVAVGIFGKRILGLTYTESFLLGSVLGAVSPAVVIPRMSKLRDEKYGTEKGIPQLVIAGSSIDDIIRIVFYQCFLTREKGGSLSARTFLNIPISIVTGVGSGILLGRLLSFVFNKVKRNDTFKLLLLLSICFGLTYLEDLVSPYFGYSSLLSIITCAIVIHKKGEQISLILKTKFNEIWYLAEIFLFILVGAGIKIEYAGKYFLPALLLLLISLVFRSLAVTGCLVKTKLTWKERGFVVISYLPKATVQAAIGGGLLDLGNQLLASGAANAESVIAAGTIVLSVSVLAILITAPFAAISRNLLYPHRLKREA
ncbi:MAG: cation:proton antiporter [Mollicutes bacterium]|nr:cation:proton antiporter [Mollicutes bacterium]